MKRLNSKAFILGLIMAVVMILALPADADAGNSNLVRQTGYRMPAKKKATKKKATKKKKTTKKKTTKKKTTKKKPKKKSNKITVNVTLDDAMFERRPYDLYLAKYKGDTYINLLDLNEALEGTPGEFRLKNTKKQEVNKVYKDQKYSKPRYKNNVVNPGKKKATLLNVKVITADGENYTFKGFRVSNKAFIKLEDAAKVTDIYTFDFYDKGDGKNKLCIAGNLPDGVIQLDRKAVDNYASEDVKSTPTWSTPCKQYLFSEGNDLWTVGADDDSSTVYVNKFDSNYNLVDNKEISYQGEKFGCFYHGTDANYMVFGNNNNEQSNSKDVLVIVKYDFNFNEIDRVTVNDCYTKVPFDAGNCNIAEGPDNIIVHMARLRYDGHQSQLTVILNKAPLQIANRDDLGAFQRNHVSHSFNQMAKYSDGNYYLLDQGDAYPRGLILYTVATKNNTTTVTNTYPSNSGGTSNSSLNVPNTNAAPGEIVVTQDLNGNTTVIKNGVPVNVDLQNNPSDQSGLTAIITGQNNTGQNNTGNNYPSGNRRSQITRTTTHYTRVGNILKSTMLLKVPGPTGANQTGVSIGGLEVGYNNVVVAANRIDYSKATGFDSYEISGSDDVYNRNVVVYIADKNLQSSREIMITNYNDENLSASIPKLVNIGSGRFMVLWQDFRKFGKNWHDDDVHYVIIDENGSIIKPDTVVKKYLLYDTQPIYFNGKVMWPYRDERQRTLLYTIDVN